MRPPADADSHLMVTSNGQWYRFPQTHMCVQMAVRRRVCLCTCAWRLCTARAALRVRCRVCLCVCTCVWAGERVGRSACGCVRALSAPASVCGFTVLPSDCVVALTFRDAQANAPVYSFAARSPQSCYCSYWYFLEISDRDETVQACRVCPGCPKWDRLATAPPPLGRHHAPFST